MYNRREKGLRILTALPSDATWRAGKGGSKMSGEPREHVKRLGLTLHEGIPTHISLKSWIKVSPDAGKGCSEGS